MFSEVRPKSGHFRPGVGKNSVVAPNSCSIYTMSVTLLAFPVSANLAVFMIGDPPVSLGI